MDIKIKILRNIAIKSLKLYNKKIIPKKVDTIISHLCCRLCNYFLDKEYKKASNNNQIRIYMDF